MTKSKPLASKRYVTRGVRLLRAALPWLKAEYAHIGVLYQASGCSDEAHFAIMRQIEQLIGEIEVAVLEEYELLEMAEGGIPQWRKVGGP